jgi:hypothetical protein
VVSNHVSIDDELNSDTPHHSVGTSGVCRVTGSTFAPSHFTRTMLCRKDSYGHKPTSMVLKLMAEPANEPRLISAGEHVQSFDRFTDWYLSIALHSAMFNQPLLTQAVSGSTSTRTAWITAAGSTAPSVCRSCSNPFCLGLFCLGWFCGLRFRGFAPRHDGSSETSPTAQITCSYRSISTTRSPASLIDTTSRPQSSVIRLEE